jgi:AraC-like DNA-binding protein
MDKAPLASGVTRHPTRNLVGQRWQLPEAEGTGGFDLTRIGADVFVVAIDVSYHDPRLELIPGDGLIQFYFKLSGDLTLGLDRKETLRLRRPSVLVYNQPTGINLKEWMASSARERGVAINVRPQYLVEQFLAGSPRAPARLRAIAAGKPDQLLLDQLSLTPSMFELARRLIDNPHQDPMLRLLYTEAVTQQLLCAAVQAFEDEAGDVGTGYGDRELRCLNEARDLLMTQLAPVPTIREIARTAGMKETTLKKAFRAVFGETMFDFSVRCRMQQAMKLLQKGGLSVAEISKAVGYAHQTSFATAFHAHFGVAPRQVRPPKGR